MAKLVRHLILDQTIAGSSPASSAKKDTVQQAVSFFLPEISRKKRDRTCVLSLLHKKPGNRKLILLQVLLVLAQLLVLLVLQELPVLPQLLVLLVLQELLVLLLVLLQELQFFLHSLRKKLSLKERGRRKIFSLLDIFCCLIIDSFISSRILKKNSDFSKDYCMAEYAKYFDIPPH